MLMLYVLWLIQDTWLAAYEVADGSTVRGKKGGGVSC
jgi:hypothetical protein